MGSALPAHFFCDVLTMSKGRVSQRARRRLECLADGGARGWTNAHCRVIWNICWKSDGNTLQGINGSHLGKRKIIFKRALVGDMLVSRRVFTTIVLLSSVFCFFFFGVLFGGDGMD